MNGKAEVNNNKVVFFRRKLYFSEPEKWVIFNIQVQIFFLFFLSLKRWVEINLVTLLN